MKKRFSQNSFLPHIETSSLQKSAKVETIYSRSTSQLTLIKQYKSSCISKLLRDVRETMKCTLQQSKSLQKLTQKKEQRTKRKQNFLNKKQKKVYYYETVVTNQNEIIAPKQTMRRLSTMVPNSVQIQQISSLMKPPHRSKTSMCIDSDKLYLYGGIGCEPNLKLAVFDMESKKWTFTEEQKFTQYHPTTPITGHSFGCYKGKGYIYGGKSTDIVNQLSIVNLKDFKFTQGEHCQYRRKQHAMTMISKFMVIHGGIQANQVTNQMYFYNTQTNTWTYPFVSPTLPYLSNHSMTSVYPLKSKKKQFNSLSDLVDPIFIFGGKDSKGNLSNALYKVTVQNDSFIASKIEFTGSIWPEKRMQMAFHHVGNGFILLYGGKMIGEQAYGDDEEKRTPIYSFNTQKLEWAELSGLQQLHDRYGMSSTVSSGKIYIFGGFVNNRYANANITVLTAWNPDVMKSRSNFGTRTVLSKQQLF